MLLAPFVFLVFGAPHFALGGSRARQLLMVGVGLVALTAFYFNGFVGAEHALRARKWTAAALSVGLLPFMSIFLMVAVWVAVIIVRALLRWAASSMKATGE